eukprot:910827-Pleurochrysis_carterae.AAC.1
MGGDYGGGARARCTCMRAESQPCLMSEAWPLVLRPVELAFSPASGRAGERHGSVAESRACGLRRAAHLAMGGGAMGNGQRARVCGLADRRRHLSGRRGLFALLEKRECRESSARRFGRADWMQRIERPGEARRDAAAETGGVAGGLGRRVALGMREQSVGVEWRRVASSGVEWRRVAS